MNHVKNIGTIAIPAEDLDAACKAVSDGFEYCGWEIGDGGGLEYLLNDGPLVFDLKSLFSCLAPFLEGQHISWLDTEWYEVTIFKFEDATLKVMRFDIDHIVHEFICSQGKDSGKFTK